jgi:hypothetical protein
LLANNFDLVTDCFLSLVISSIVTHYFTYSLVISAAEALVYADAEAQGP